MIRYPLFDFDGDDLAIYEAHEEHWSNLEPYDLEYGDGIFDIDGRVLRQEDAGNGRVAIVDSGAEPDPERLRLALLALLRRRGEDLADDASLKGLVELARSIYYV